MRIFSFHNQTYIHHLGFTTASAIIVTLAQGTHIFGISVTRYSGFLGPIKTFISILSGIFGGVNWRSVTISAVSIPFLYFMKLLQIKHKEKLKGFPIPSELFLVALTTLSKSFFYLSTLVHGDKAKPVCTAIRPSLKISNFDLQRN